jgi:dihydroxyacid dehydratase/phosphogluconate dehydratase
MAYGLTREELQSGKPIIGIAQSGSDLAPCNRHHIELAKRVREGIREAGGVALEFPSTRSKRPSSVRKPRMIATCSTCRWSSRCSTDTRSTAC